MKKMGCQPCRKGLPAFISRNLGTCPRCIRFAAFGSLMGWIALAAVYFFWHHAVVMGLALVFAAGFTLVWISHSVTFLLRTAAVLKALVYEDRAPPERPIQERRLERRQFFMALGRSTLTILIPFGAILSGCAKLVYRKESTITIFGRDIALRNHMERFGHERPFVDLIEVDELHYNVAERLTKAEMERCVSALMSKTQQPASTIEEAVQLFLFTSDEHGSLSTISLDKTHAFSILTSRGNLLEHYYFEKQSEAVFQKVPSLSMAISSPLDLDDVRLLHFASAGAYDLPSKSSIYELITAHAFRSGGLAKKKDNSIRISLLLDSARRWGAHTLGLIGNEIYLAFLINRNGSFCGGNGHCPEGTDSCGNAPGGPDKVCGAIGDGGGGDTCVAVSHELKKQRIPLPVPLDFVLVRSFRKNFLTRYKKGRDYISYYYVTALFIKLDRNILGKYVRAIPHVDRAMREFLSGSNENAIITTALRDSLLSIIKDHRDIQNQVFQEILDIVEEDLNSSYGMTKGQLMDALSRQT